MPAAAALMNGELAPAFERFRRGLSEQGDDGNRRFARVLELCVEH